MDFGWGDLVHIENNFGVGKFRKTEEGFFGKLGRINLDTRFFGVPVVVFRVFPGGANMADWVEGKGFHAAIMRGRNRGGQVDGEEANRRLIWSSAEEKVKRAGGTPALLKPEARQS